MKKNIISFSLWGDHEKYINGALENLRLAPEIYPNWKVRIYIDETLNENYKNKLIENGAELISCKNNNGRFFGAFWRFFVNDDETVDRYIVRDIDSRLNFREQAAVKEWIKSDKDYHIMRDHPNHRFKIQAGMWGGKANKFKILPLMSNVNSDYCQRKGCDEAFLGDFIFDKVKNSCVIHDPFYDKKPFPQHKPIYDGGTFVGQDFVNNIPQGGIPSGSL